jgi:hypothetical protein
MSVRILERRMYPNNSIKVLPVAKFVKVQIINEMANVKLQMFFPKSNNPSNRFTIKIADALVCFQKQQQYIKYLFVE